MTKNYFILIVLSAIVLLTVVYGLLDGGSPKAARDFQSDSTRVQNIQTVKYAIESYYGNYHMLPSTLTEAYNANGSYTPASMPKDPVTNKEYIYSKLGEQSYQICSTFDADTKTNGGVSDPFSHPSGYHCFPFIPGK